jgi:hypothetical protein
VVAAAAQKQDDYDPAAVSAAETAYAARYSRITHETAAAAAAAQKQDDYEAATVVSAESEPNVIHYVPPYLIYTSYY